MIAKIDLEKAYDRVDWDFLEEVLQKVGFGNQLTKVILNCIKSTKLPVLWNGQQLESFTPERGLRQGDSLSPYLFVLCMEVLHYKIQNAVTAKLVETLQS